MRITHLWTSGFRMRRGVGHLSYCMLQKIKKCVTWLFYHSNNMHKSNIHDAGAHIMRVFRRWTSKLSLHLLFLWSPYIYLLIKMIMWTICHSLITPAIFLCSKKNNNNIIRTKLFFFCYHFPFFSENVVAIDFNRVIDKVMLLFIINFIKNGESVFYNTKNWQFILFATDNNRFTLLKLE